MTRTAIPRWVVIGLMAVGVAVAARFATLAVLGSPVTKSVESPVLSIRPTQLDFGDVWEQEQFIWPVQVENTTDQPQDVQSISGSCAC